MHLDPACFHYELYRVCTNMELTGTVVPQQVGRWIPDPEGLTDAWVAPKQLEEMAIR